MSSDLDADTEFGEETTPGVASAESNDARGQTLLEVQDLRTTFYTDKETIRAVDGVSFAIHRGETVGVVGESGSGKSVTARSIMGLVESPGRIHPQSRIKFRDLGRVRDFASAYSKQTADVSDLDAVIANNDDVETPAEAYDHVVGDDDFVFVERRDGEDIVEGYIDVARAPEDAQRKLRGGDIAMIFQDPLSSLNPVYTVGNQIKEALRLHRDLRGSAATEEAIDLLEAVGIPDAPRRLREYPHEFSGGMRQRAVIAMALACDPELIIADEPTTALDVTIQAQILDLLQELQEERDLGIMFITHDMGVIAEVADRVNVMYAGEVVENAPVTELFENPYHPYTQGLLESIPGWQEEGDRLSTIEGDVPTPTDVPTKCRFAPRCPKAFDECEMVHPVLVDVNDEATDHTTACLLYPEDSTREEAIERHETRDREIKTRFGESDQGASNDE